MAAIDDCSLTCVAGVKAEVRIQAGLDFHLYFLTNFSPVAVNHACAPAELPAPFRACSTVR